jgi:hypothetical protein
VFCHFHNSYSQQLYAESFAKPHLDILNSSHVDRFILGLPGHLGLYVARNADCDDIDMGSQGKAALQ